MSVIQKIRTKYAKLAGGVIAVALVAFILMDALSSRSGNLFGNDTSVVTVNGEKVDYIEYTRRTKDYEVLYGSNQTVDDNFRAQINDMALQDLVKEQLIAEQADKIGLVVTDAEKKDMIYGNDPDQQVKSYQPFTNPNTKAFDPQYVKLFEEQADQLDPTGKARAHWETYKDYILRNSLTKKFNTLFTSSVYTPKFLVQARAKEQAQMASIDYVSVPFETVKDEEITITDADYNAFLKKNKEDYTTEVTTRAIEYVTFNVTPTAQDTARALGVLNSIKPDFINAEDAESFVNRNSEESFDGSYKIKKSYQSVYADSIFSLPVGGVFGPVYEGEDYKMVKVIDKKTYPDSVKCRHILIKTSDRGQLVVEDSIAKMKMDSVVAAIKSGASFVDMVQQYTDDEGSKQNGGEYTFSFEQKTSLSKEFSDFIFDGKTGEKKVVKVENGSYGGYHYIEILNQEGFAPALKLAVVTKGLFAGDETENNVYASAAEFAGSNSKAADFDKAAAEQNLQKLVADNIKISDFTIPGIGPSREIIRWMYNAEKNEVSQVFALTGKYIIAKLTAVNKAGLRTLDSAMRQNIEPEVKNEKKAELIVKKYNGKNSLAEIAQATESQVQSFDSFRGNNSFSGPMGYAPKVIGYSFSNELKPNSVSNGIKEQSGVYYISLKSRNTVAEQDSVFIEREREMMQMETKNALSGKVTEQLKKKASIKYNPDMY